MKIIKIYQKHFIIFLNSKFKNILNLISEKNFFNKLQESEYSGRQKIFYFIFENKKIMVRQNFHGGLFSFLNNKFFLYSRFINEFILHNYLFYNNFATIKPIGVFIIKKKYFYNSYYLTIEANAKNLYTYLKEQNQKIDFEFFEKITNKFYELIFKYNIFHNDLQVKNILLKNDEILIIDFNKSKKIFNFHRFFFLLNIFRFYGSLKKNNLISDEEILNKILLNYNFDLNKIIKKILIKLM
ncbi:MAG TPA: lipopolysaccharide kinase InaA family protein [bacterium]|nr:lipopolysaccharide kinase InaA family protein [bacterium]HOL47045.1 lipopolysaccharide kinase InaA family protein [bacterium]HPQ17950.1 lipopolysaccharide kinase InaA family protein [bacterium]